MKSGTQGAIEFCPQPFAVTVEHSAFATSGVNGVIGSTGDCPQINLGWTLLGLPVGAVKTQNYAIVTHGPSHALIVTVDGKQGRVFFTGSKSATLFIYHPTPQQLPLCAIEVKQSAHPAHGI